MGAGFSPLDEELGLLPGRLSPRLQESLARLGTWMPFGRAAAELAWFTRTSVSEASAARCAEAAGAAYVAFQTAEVERLERETPAAPRGPAVQQLSADGAMVPLVGGVWGEVKTVAIGTLELRPDGQAQATELSYFSRLTDHESFARLATVELHRRGTETAGTVVGVMDGADWLQSFLDYHRPDTVRVLDFPHALGHLATVAQVTFGPGTAQTSAWLEAQSDALKHGAPSAVLVALQELPTAAATNPDLADQARNGTFRYLEKRLDQLRYAEFLAAGYPIGSGLVESANKLVVEARLKGSGMHWAPEHVDPLLALRNIACADRWGEAWPAICRQLQAQADQRRTRRRAARHPVPTSPQSVPAPPLPAARRPVARPVRPADLPRLVVDGRPTAQHPWKRRPFLFGRHDPAKSAKL